jgi:hypothetical protein
MTLMTLHLVIDVTRARANAYYGNKRHKRHGPSRLRAPERLPMVACARPTCLGASKWLRSGQTGQPE